MHMPLPILTCFTIKQMPPTHDPAVPRFSLLLISLYLPYAILLSPCSSPLPLLSSHGCFTIWGGPQSMITLLIPLLLPHSVPS